jgi:hypothetical protein
MGQVRLGGLCHETIARIWPIHSRPLKSTNSCHYLFTMLEVVKPTGQDLPAAN